MGQNSQEVAYGFGQMGSVHVKTANSIFPPAGMVVVAIQFIAANVLSVLRTEADSTKGITLFGRWSALTTSGATANTDGVICYFGR